MYFIESESDDDYDEEKNYYTSEENVLNSVQSHNDC